MPWDGVLIANMGHQPRVRRRNMLQVIPDYFIQSSAAGWSGRFIQNSLFKNVRLREQKNDLNRNIIL